MSTHELPNKYAVFPATYRTQAVKEILRWVKLGESGVVIGSSGSGKSNIAGYLANRPGVTQQWLPAGQNSYLFLLLNVNGLPAVNTANLYRVMLHTVQQAVAHHAELSTALKAIRAELPNTPDVLDLYLALQSAHQLLLNRDDQHVIWLFDRFDTACQRLEAETLNSLRNLRDLFKDQLSYIAFTRYPLARLRNPAEYDEFYELMSRHTYWVEPMDFTDAQWIAAQVMKRYDLALPPVVIEQLYQICGGLPAFLKDAYSAFAEGLLPIQATVAEWEQILLTVPGLQRNCNELWQSLRAEEQALLAATAFQEASVPNYEVAKTYLQPIGLVVPASLGNRLEIFSSLFAQFIRHQPREKGITIRGGLVIRNGLPLPKDKELARLEFRLLEHLLQHAGQVCTKDELLQHLFPDEENGSSDERLTGIMRRLRAKIDTNEWKYIETKFGRGYQLVQPPDTPTL